MQADRMVPDKPGQKKAYEPDANCREKRGDQIQTVQRQNSLGQDFHLT
jgi:hypothetical protein